MNKPIVPHAPDWSAASAEDILRDMDRISKETVAATAKVPEPTFISVRQHSILGRLLSKGDA